MSSPAPDPPAATGSDTAGTDTAGNIPWWERLALTLSLASRSRAGRADASSGREPSRRDAPDSDADDLKHPGDLSPFLDARRAATNHFTRLNRKARRYMLLSLVLATAVVILAGGLVALALSSEVIAFEVRTDGETGQVLRASRIEPLDGSVDALLVRAKLKAFVRGLRTVYADRRATAKSLRSSYSLIIEGSAAQTFLTDYFNRTGENPVREVGQLQRSVQEIALNNVAGTNTWRLRWRERELGRPEGPRERVFEGSLSLRQRGESDDLDRLEENPLGVHVVGLSYHAVRQEMLRSSGRAEASRMQGDGRGPATSN